MQSCFGDLSIKGANCGVAAARLQAKSCFAGQFGAFPEKLTKDLIHGNILKTIILLEM